MRTPLLAVPLLVLACALAAPSATPAGAPPGAKPVRSVSAAPRMPLPFIGDDYSRALAQARARKVPLFIESWAPW